MASAPAFDTLAYARRLKAAGVDDAQAEAHAEADLETATAGLRADVTRLEDKIGNCATKFKVALGIVVAQTTLTVALTVALIELIGGAL